MLAWRPARADDLPAIHAIAAQVHPAFPEDAAVFAERLRLYPAGVWMLEGPAGPLGYLIAHPWRGDDVPALDTLLGALPAGADLLYLHDLALMPAARGSGVGRAIVERIAAHSRAESLRAIRLVAINGSVPFWERQGFVVCAGGDLTSYGADARRMERPLA
ncbi:GNAT family N-acetyltransferase [Sphingomonas sp. CJ20]